MSAGVLGISTVVLARADQRRCAGRASKTAIRWGGVARIQLIGWHVSCSLTQQTGGFERSGTKAVPEQVSRRIFRCKNGTIEGKYNNIICHMCMLHVDLVIVNRWRNKVKAGAVACCHSSGCK